MATTISESADEETSAIVVQSTELNEIKHLKLLVSVITGSAQAQGELKRKSRKSTRENLPESIHLPPLLNIHDGNGTLTSPPAQHHFSATTMEKSSINDLEAAIDAHIASQHDDNVVESHAKDAGERWSPESEIRKGSVVKFTEMFGGAVGRDAPSTPAQSQRTTTKELNEKMWSSKDDIMRRDQAERRIDSNRAMRETKLSSAVPSDITVPLASEDDMSDQTFPDAIEGVFGGDDSRNIEQEESIHQGTDDEATNSPEESIPQSTSYSSSNSDSDSYNGKFAQDTLDWIPEEDESASTEDDSVTTLDAPGTPIREEIMHLMSEVLPDELDDVDDLLKQFDGREEELRDALLGMQMQTKRGAIANNDGEVADAEQQNDDEADKEMGEEGASSEGLLEELGDDKVESNDVYESDTPRSSPEPPQRSNAEKIFPTGEDDTSTLQSGNLEKKESALLCQYEGMEEVSTAQMRSVWESMKQTSEGIIMPMSPYDFDYRIDGDESLDQDLPTKKKTEEDAPDTKHVRTSVAAVGTAAATTLQGEEHVDNVSTGQVVTTDAKSTPKPVAGSEKDTASNVKANVPAEAIDAPPVVPHHIGGLSLKGSSSSSFSSGLSSTSWSLNDSKKDRQKAADTVTTAASFSPCSSQPHEGDIEEGIPRKNSVAIDPKNGTHKAVSELSFEHSPNHVPTTIGVVTNASCTQSVVTRDLTTPTPWWKRRQTFAFVVFLLVATCAAVLSLFFTGAFDSDGTDGSFEVVAPVATATTTPSSMPSLPPIHACTQEEVSSEFNTFGLGNSPSQYPPRVAMDRNNSVVVTNSGEVRFYSLVGGEWLEIDNFPNINNSRFTPAVSLSDKVAVVGFLHVSEQQGSGGVHVYEQDMAGRWKRGEVLAPDGGLNAAAKFGWSVDVDAEQKYPRVAVGAYGENNNAGSVHVFERSSTASWSQKDKILPETCSNGNFGYSVSIQGDVIAASTDCEYIVQLNEYNRTSNSFKPSQNIRYVSFDSGAIGIDSLVLNEQNLVYSTVFGGVIIYERMTSDSSFNFLEQLDISGNKNLTHYPLALDKDILAVGVGNKYMIMSKNGDDWSSFYIVNGDASAAAPSLAVAGRHILAGSGSPDEVYHYSIQDCTLPMSTQSPTHSMPPTTSTQTIPHTPDPTTKKPTTSPTLTNSMAQTNSTSMTAISPTPDPTTKNPTTSPTLSLASSPSASPIIASSGPSFSPTKKQAVVSLPPSASPTTQAATPSPPSTSPQGLCYPVEIVIMFDSSPFGTGYVLTNVDNNDSFSFFPSDDSLANQIYTESACLDEGTFKFVMYDSYGDGLGSGKYAITSDGVTLAQGGEFTFSEETTFELPAAR